MQFWGQHKRAAKSGVGRPLVDHAGHKRKKARNRNGSGLLLVDIW